MTIMIEASNLAKSYGKLQALKPSSFRFEAGQIIGVIGANGAGKTTMLNTLLGLISYDGTLSVMGRNPYTDRASLMQDVSYIADVATLPKWMRVRELIAVVAGLHPKFDRAKAEARLARTNVRPDSKIKTLSKGMIVQVHLALALAIDAKLLVLDEPTLGLDILNRRAFYDTILTDYFDETRTIIVTTHQVEEIEHVLSHVMMIRDGAVLVHASLDDLGERFFAVDVNEANLGTARQLAPIYQRSSFGRTTCVFDGIDPQKLAGLGDVRRVPLADLFVALNPV
jgi:ABC-2 type transport system ATP-binding protein